MTRQGLRIGIDLGGTKIEAVALDPGGEVIARRRASTPADEYHAILKTIGALIHEIEFDSKEAATVGIAAPGAISPLSGLMKNSNTTVLNGRALDRDLRALLQRPIRVENDANCFALSETVDGAAKGARAVFGVILGTGVGGGVVIDGKLIVGPNRIAGEWGHNSLPRMEPDEFPGPRCYCGRDGCIETFLSGPALAHDFFQRTGKRLLAQEIAALGDAGDAQALETVDLYRNRLARALASVVNIFDPEVIVLGGGVSNMVRIYEGLHALVEDYAFTDSLSVKIVKNLHGDSSGVRGAAWLWGRTSGAR
jgi:fructokinase